MTIKFISNIQKNIAKSRERKIEYNKEMSKLEITTKIKLSEMQSDLRYFKPNFLNRMKNRFFPQIFCLCLIHFPDNIDVIKYFPMPKPFVVDINSKLYLFSPKAFRFINNTAKLEFYANFPFAVLHNVTDKYTPPSVDADAFSSVMNSKHVQDATTVKDDKDINGVMMAVLIFSIINALIVVFVIFKLNAIQKLIG